LLYINVYCLYGILSSWIGMYTLIGIEVMSATFLRDKLWDVVAGWLISGQKKEFWFDANHFIQTVYDAVQLLLIDFFRKRLLWQKIADNTYRYRESTCNYLPLSHNSNIFTIINLFLQVFGVNKQGFSQNFHSGILWLFPLFGWPSFGWALGQS